MDVLAFITDAFGGHGGIARYNQDLLVALCEHPSVSEVVAIPRLATGENTPLPSKLRWIGSAAGSVTSYLGASARAVTRGSRPDLVLCGHLHLLPLAFLASRRYRVPLVLLIYGIEAWRPTERVLVDVVAARADIIVSISEYTLDRFLAWAHAPRSRCHLLPNAIDTVAFCPGPKPQHLLLRYGLVGRRVIMSLGRMSATERYKGFDEVLAVLPLLLRDLPDLTYLVVGDGDDRARLEQQARALRIADRVMFAGRIPEGEKVDHYRLADAFVMASRGEGFGFVYLEAMACGIPVVASRLDGSREAVRDGTLGVVIDPTDPDELRKGILTALGRPRNLVPEGLSYFSIEKFRQRLSAILQPWRISGSQ